MNKKLYIIGAAVCAALFLFSAVMLFRQYEDSKQSADTFAEIAELVQTEEAIPEEETAVPESEEDEKLEKATAMTALEKYGAVFEQNPDFIGWISIDDTNVNYPVMQTVNNPNFYLKHGFDKSYSDYGVPYMQENCIMGISDNCVIYGHHMNDGSMFADLCKYEDPDFYKEHPIIHFDTLSGCADYEIITVFKTVAYSEDGFKFYHFITAEDASDFDDYVSSCKELALYDTGVSAEYGDKLITLSTCEYSRTNGRLVVVAKRIPSPMDEVS